MCQQKMEQSYSISEDNLATAGVASSGAIPTERDEGIVGRAAVEDFRARVTRIGKDLSVK